MTNPTSLLEGKEFEVLRVGTFVDSKGVTHHFDEARLDKIAASYDPAKHEAPMVIGHPETNAPAFGWIKGLRRDGLRFLATPTQVQPEFEEMVKSGKFKKRSISLYPDDTVRHVGFLGAKPPAVKGLRDIAFSEDEAVTVEFGEDDFRINTLARIAVRLRDFILQKFGADTANNIMNQYDVEAVLQEPEDEDENNEQTLFKENDMAGEPDVSAKFAELEKKQAEFAEALASKDETIKEQAKTIEALSARVDGQASESKRVQIAAFCERLGAQGKLTPAQIPGIAAVMGKLGQAGTAEFGEGDAKVSKTVEALLREFLDGLPAQVEFGEFATKDRAGEKPGAMDAQALAKKITEKVDSAARSGRVIGFAEAQSEVLREQKEGK
ncbi:MAG: hypothetical protein HQK81_06170 [Desulfovibrionaceae bacterium]|nr:hypothetical protein [Desulfovibrionaceae bacterium]MBF0513635.1 hypothetical protein [Desulfovibrionaceae bacterium]